MRLLSFPSLRRLYGFVAVLLLSVAGAAAWDVPVSNPPDGYSWPKAKRAPKDIPVAVPVQFKNAPSGKIAPQVRRALLVQSWWSMFHDPVLDNLENAALSGNQDLAQAVESILESRQRARADAADFFPHLSVPISANRQRTTGTGPVTESRIVGGSFGGLGSQSFGSNSFAGQQLANTYDDFQGALSLKYELDVFGRIRHTWGQAVANAQASEADRRAVQLSLNAEVATDYFALRALDAQVAVLRHTLALRQEAVELQQKRLQRGQVSQLEVAQADVELANTEADLSDAVRERAEQENSLAVLCGQTAGDFSVPGQPLDNSPPPFVPASVPSQVMRQRPDIVESERKLAAATEGIGAARADLLPTFNLVGSYGADTAQLNQAFEGASNTWMFGFSVNIPVFEGGKNTANLKAARAARAEAFAGYQQTVLTAFKEVENAIVDLRERATESEARERAVTSAKKVFEYSRERYVEGAISYFDVIDSERALLNAELSRVQTLNARYSATVDLVRAVGGSYEDHGFSLTSGMGTGTVRTK